MHLAVIADAYPPMKTSGAVQIRDLVAEMAAQGHEVTVLLPDSSLRKSWTLTKDGNISVLRLKAPETKDIPYIRRAIAEYRLSGCMYRGLKKSPFSQARWQGIVWYSPTIFFGSLVSKLRRDNQCPTYLILRDLFPEWAVDMGLLKKGLIYRYFKKVEKFQYMQADTIGVQTDSVLDYFNVNQKDVHARMEVLNNWLSKAFVGHCSVDVSVTGLAGRQIFVYTGNIGIAQGMDILIDLANAMRDDQAVGFLFVGRGSVLESLRNKVADYNLDNILFYDEIPAEEIPGLLAKCHVGLIALDPRHSNDNIPGKFLAYMQAGIPVLASINTGNDLVKIIDEYRVGKVITSNTLADLEQKANELLAESSSDIDLKKRCQQLAATTFSTETAVRQIVTALGR